jgi:hypothetical protein
LIQQAMPREQGKVAVNQQVGLGKNGLAGKSSGELQRGTARTCPQAAAGQAGEGESNDSGVSSPSSAPRPTVNAPTVESRERVGGDSGHGATVEGACRQPAQPPVTDGVGNERWGFRLSKITQFRTAPYGKIGRFDLDSKREDFQNAGRPEWSLGLAAMSGACPDCFHSAPSSSTLWR